MHRNKRLSSRIAGALVLICLALSMVAGANQGTAPASAAVKATPPSSGAPATKREQVLVVRVYFHDFAERDKLAVELSAEEVATTGGFLTAIINQATYNKLLARGLRVEIDQAQTNEANDPHVFDAFYGGYKTVEEIQTYLDQEVATYPGIAEKVDIGDSWCKSHAGSCTQPNANNGYDLLVMHITNRSIPGPKPVFWLDTGIHAREIAVHELALRYIDYLLSNYNTNADAHWLVDYNDIWVMPVVNPDGHHIVEAGGGGSSPYWQRKNGNYTNGCNTWPPTSGTQFGIDNNRNFTFQWGCCGGSSSAPCDQTYRGPSAGSEDETQAIMNKIRALIPDQRGPGLTDPAPITTTGVLQSMHSNASLDLYPWGFTTTAPPNGTDMANIGAHESAINAGGNGYQACQPPNCLYAVDGDTVDWAYGELGIPAMTTEIGGSSFFPPYSQVDGFFNLNKGMLLYLAKISRQPYLINRGPDANTVATSPMTVTQGTVSQLTGTSNYNWTANHYSQNVAAAEYYVDTPPWAGGTAIPMTAVDGTFNSPTEAVQADVDTTSLAPGRHILFMRGRGINDYVGYQSWGVVSAAFLDILPAGSPVATSTPTNTPTRTPSSAPTNTATNTPVVNTPTNTPLGNTPTNTPVGATATNTPAGGTATNTPAGGTATNTPAGTTPTFTPTPCGITFSDVQTTDYFYEPVRWLYCHRAISGYSDNTFRPGNLTTRGQLSKIVVLAEGWTIYTPTTPTFRDVPTTDAFYQFIETAYSRSIISGYGCGTGCLEFRPTNNVTRSQLTKIVVLAQNWAITPPTTPTFRDVPVGDAFFGYVETAYAHNIISGYTCGAGCLEFRPGNNATRGQISKIVYLAVTSQ